MFEIYENVLREVANKFAPARTTEVRRQPIAVWFDDESRLLRRQSRMLERRYRRSGLVSDRLLWIQHERTHHKANRLKENGYTGWLIFRNTLANLVSCGVLSPPSWGWIERRWSKGVHPHSLLDFYELGCDMEGESCSLGGGETSGEETWWLTRGVRDFWKPQWRIQYWMLRVTCLSACSWMSDKWGGRIQHWKPSNDARASVSASWFQSHHIRWKPVFLPFWDQIYDQFSGELLCPREMLFQSPSGLHHRQQQQFEKRDDDKMFCLKRSRSMFFCIDIYMFSGEICSVLLLG